jgi:epoxyqueuosine reductase
MTERPVPPTAVIEPTGEFDEGGFNREVVVRKARALGFDVCRITTAAPPESGHHFIDALAEGRHGNMEWLARNSPKRLDPQLVLPGARSVIVLGASYHIEAASTPGDVPGSNRGLVARYARRADYHDTLAEPLKALASWLDACGGSGSRSLWYVDTGPVLERDLAQRAGVGFVGKHTNVISRTHGNWLLLAEILTTLELAPDVPEKNRCGTCSRCLDVCPTRCITAPFTLDARRCISYLTIELKGAIPVELRPLIGNRVFGCDECLAVCPWNRFAQEGALLKSGVREEFSEPDLIEWLNLDAAQFKARFTGTPLLRTKRRGILRNVCVALGNTGTVEALPALERASADSEPLVVEHALWAISEIRRRYGLASG